MESEEGSSDGETLVIFLDDAHVKFAEATSAIHMINCTWEDAEVYGRNWVRLFKNDIVMLVEKEDNE